MGNILTYSYVIPRTWDENYNEQELINIIWDQLGPYMDEENNWFFGPVITIAGVTAILNVMNHRLCWWFAIPGDRVPIEERYRFSSNFLNIGFWANQDIVINILDDDHDADTVTLDDNNGTDNANYWSDRDEAVIQAEIRNRQFE